jgi:hypothetical protein
VSSVLFAFSSAVDHVAWTDPGVGAVRRVSLGAQMPPCPDPRGPRVLLGEAAGSLELRLTGSRTINPGAGGRTWRQGRGLQSGRTRRARVARRSARLALDGEREGRRSRVRARRRRRPALLLRGRARGRSSAEARRRAPGYGSRGTGLGTGSVVQGRTCAAPIARLGGSAFTDVVSVGAGRRSRRARAPAGRRRRATHGVADDLA